MFRKRQIICSLAVLESKGLHQMLKMTIVSLESLSDTYKCCCLVVFGLLLDFLSHDVGCVHKPARSNMAVVLQDRVRFTLRFTFAIALL